MQENRRHLATNGETLTTHFATLQALFEEYDFDAFRIYYLNDTGVSVGRDDRGTKRGREVLLLFDGHRSHMLVRVLQHLSENGLRSMAIQSSRVTRNAAYSWY